MPRDRARTKPRQHALELQQPPSPRGDGDDIDWMPHTRTQKRADTPTPTDASTDRHTSGRRHTFTYRLSKDRALVIRRRDVRYCLYRLNDSCLPFGLRLFRVCHEVEAIRNVARLPALAIPGCSRGPKFGLIRVGGLVQVQMGREGNTIRSARTARLV